MATAKEKVVPKVGDIWHRVENTSYGSIDEWGTVTSVTTKLSKYKLVVVKVTPKGVWLVYYWAGESLESVLNETAKGSVVMLRERRFVRLDAVRRYAYPTEKEAMEGFVARKRRQVKILQSQLRTASEALAAGEFELKTRFAPEVPEPAPKEVAELAL
ncbi:uncharacterized protein NMK_2195 [Novimethylophilus kurashikiensis]|uniref:Uncharacterized protein n=1 Tax=Novimethylophilus kurashikiensis TaxID=1825523 RepID=A0A2R5F8P4_9PROT|nr:hypothetical protein [Novimethylophilus kurashikiensis]GBG14596.1 uncharacterized protein NMK_2195 [Novimethylophilus kurashikiensis]